MASINFVLIVGRIGSIDIRKAGDKEIASISVATSSGYKNKNDEWKESTEWHKCIFAISQVVERVKALKKGDMIEVRGSIRTNKWVDKDGKTHESKEISGTQFSIFSKATLKENKNTPQETPINLSELAEENDLPF